jgi:two-component system KDP operon response regulator KdpE
MKGSVLIVEDDAALRQSLRSALTAIGLKVETAATGEEAVKELNVEEYDVVLMDLNMPGMGGMASCRLIRETHPAIAIIVLTVRDHNEDKVKALEAGADDYVTKPFHLPELLARIRAALRRSRSNPLDRSKTLSGGEINIDPAQHKVSKGQNFVHLTPKEFDLLHTLMLHADRPLSHRALLTTIWGPEYGNEREYLRTYINQLRRKLEDDPARPKYLLTENYIGYKFAVPNE